MDDVFVGREHELGLLHASLVEAQAGQPTTVLLDGEAGTGKTALVARFLTEASGLTTLRARGDEAERGLRYGVLRQLLAAARDAGQRLAEELAAVAGPLPDPLTVGARFLDVLGAAQGDGAVIVVVDDAQSADAPSLRALTFALRRLLHDCLMCVVCVREATDPRLPESLRRLVDERGHRITLGGLGAEPLGRLAHDVAGITLTPRAAERLRDHTGGNPLHARALLEEVPEALADIRRPLPAPSSFSMLVLSRLSACSPAAERLAVATAVVGQHSALSVAATVADLDKPLPALEEAVTAGILMTSDRPDGRFIAFTHPLVRAAVYGGLGPVRRAELHARAATLLSGAAALDHRLAAAATEDTTLVADLTEAAAAEASSGSRAAAADRLLSAAGFTDDLRERDSLLLDAMDHLLVGGEVGAAAALSAQVEALTDTARGDYLLGLLALLQGQGEEAEARLERAWSLHDPAEDRELRTAIAAQRAQLSLVGSRGAEAAAWANEALAAGVSEGPLMSAARTYGATGLAISGHPTDGLALLAAAPDDLAEPERLAVLLGQGAIEMWTDDLAAARTDLALVADAFALGPWPIRLAALGHLAEVEFRTGDWDDALAHAELAVSLLQDTEQVWLLPFAHANTALVLAAEGRWQPAREHVEASLAWSDALGPGESASTSYSCQAAAYLAYAQNDFAGVLDAVAPLVDLGRTDGMYEPGFFSWRELHVEALVATGRLDEAEAALRPYEDDATARGRRSAMAGAARARGQLAAANGDEQRAEEAFGTGAALLAGLAMPFARGLLEEAYGRCLRRARRRRDAAAHLGEAHRLLAGLGAGPFAEECEREMAACGLQPTKRKLRDPTRLTPQELAVARLVASGMTNAEVAQRLVVSVKTVEHHLGRVFAKLGVTSRRQLPSHPFLTGEEQD